MSCERRRQSKPRVHIGRYTKRCPPALFSSKEWLRFPTSVCTTKVVCSTSVRMELATSPYTLLALASTL